MYRWLLALVIGLILVPSSVLAAPPQAPGSQAFPTSSVVYFPETGHNVAMQLKRFFDAYGGVATFGMPLTELIVGADGLQVQYFERARLELRPTAPPDARVTVTRAGALLSEGRSDPAFAWLVASPDPERTFFPESGHTLGGAFGWFWQTRGGLPIFGYPISEEFYEYDPDSGQERLVQYFERARFVYYPEHMGADNEVMLSPLGRQLLQRDPLALAATAPARPITLLGEASTGFSTSSTSRVTNIQRATALIDGYVVPAGAEFSFISIGDFSEANGFVDGYAIVGGRLEKVIGGGLCQVSTTLFRAVSNAGLNVTRRVPHSHIVYFYDDVIGFDATVFVPGVDFRWRNDTRGPVYIIGIVDLNRERLTFQLFGEGDGRSVRYEGPFKANWTQPGPPVWQFDPGLPRGAVRQLVHGRPGVDVTLRRIITFANGQTRVDPYITRYTPWEDFYLYGPGVTPPRGARVIAPRN